MANFICKPEPLKRLGELLQEQQEPFLLDVFLRERGYLKKAMNLKDRRNENSFKNSKGFGNSRSKRRKGGVPHCSKVLKSVVDKLVSLNEHQKTSSNYNRAFEGKNIEVCATSESTRTLGELDQFSYSSSMADFDASSESDGGDNNSPSCQHTSVESSQPLKLRNFKEQIMTDGVNQWRCIEDNKQHSPVSVLDLPHNQEAFWFRTNKRETLTTSSFKLPKKVTEDSIFSAALRALQRHSTTSREDPTRITRPQEVRNNASSQHVKKKTALKQTKLLLFDCVREAVENSTGRNRKESSKQQVQEFLGAVKVGKFMCDRNSLWGKQSGNLKHIAHLINSDLRNPKDEWIDLKPQVKQIALQIECIIWEKMRNEILLDLLTIEIKR